MTVAELQTVKIMCGSNRSAKICENLITERNELRMRTCKIRSHKFEQTFSCLSSENNVWTVKDRPSGDCGIINVSRFEKDADFLWRPQN